MPSFSLAVFQLLSFTMSIGVSRSYGGSRGGHNTDISLRICTRVEGDDGQFEAIQSARQS